MAKLKTGTTIDGNTAWHAGNDGSGSGLDADTLDGSHASTFAPLASPALTGNPTAPTATAGDNDTTIATTAFVSTAISNLVNGASASFDTLKEIQDAMATDTELSNAIAGLTIGNGTQTITAGTGLSGGGSFTANQTGNSSVTLNLDLSEFTDMTADVNGLQDEMILLDNGAERRKLLSEIKLSQFNNDAGWAAGDITNLTAGGGLTGGGSSGSVTISHADTSSQASLTALTGANVISDIDVDTYGHITSMSTRALTAANIGAAATSHTHSNYVETAGDTMTGDLILDHDGTGTAADSHALRFTARAANTDFSREIKLEDGGGFAFDSNILLTGDVTTSNKARTIDFTGFDKEGTTDFTDRAYIQHTTNTGGHSGSVLVISSQNDSTDGIAFLTNASSKLKHNSNNIATESWVQAQGYLTSETGDIQGVTAGSGLTGGGTSGTPTLNVGAGTGISVAADSVAIASAYSPNTAIELNSSQNLNDITTAGFYYQTANADTSGNNYPSGEAGSLLVQKSAGLVTQTYTTYSSTPKIYVRTYYSSWGSWKRMFNVDYHPNADTLTTARNIALTGAVTGNANFDGSGNISIATTHTADPTITLTGAVTGSGTMTNLGNVSIATTATADPTLTINGDASGSATFTNLGNATLTLTVNDDSHNHIISNVDGLQTALDGKASSSHNHSATEIVTGELNTARMGSGTATSGYVLKSDGDGTASWQQDNNTTYSLGSFGVTATAAELNKMDGVTATTAELNYVDGVTSNIQTQLNSKISGNQTITLSGDASGSGTTSIAVTVNDNSHKHNASTLDIPGLWAFQYSNTTTQSDPGSGYFRLNNATQSSATGAVFDDVDYYGRPFDVAGAEMLDGAIISLYAVDTAGSNWDGDELVRYYVNTATDSAGFTTLGLKFLEASADAIDNGDIVYVRVTPFPRASNTIAGGLKARVSGTTLYLRNDSANA